MVCGRVSLFVVLVVLSVLALTGCTGAVADENPYSGAHSANPEANPENLNPENNPDLNGPSTDVGFALNTTNVRLLPFEVRVGKLEVASGMDRTDPAFAGLMDAAVQLGGSNHAAGVAADLTWSSNRITTWVRHLKPICSSENFQPYASVAELVTRAYGRDANDEDIELVRSTLADSGVTDEGERNLITCLAVLSSTEFVLQ